MKIFLVFPYTTGCFFSDYFIAICFIITRNIDMNRFTNTQNVYLLFMDKCFLVLYTGFSFPLGS